MAARSHLEGLWSAELVGDRATASIGVLVFEPVRVSQDGYEIRGEAEVLDHVRAVVGAVPVAAADAVLFVEIAEYLLWAEHQNADVGAAIARA